MASSDENAKFLATLMLDKFDHVDNKLEKHGEILTSIEISVAKNLVSLEEHMRRTSAAESRLNIVENKLEPLVFTNKSIKWVLGLATTLIVAILVKMITKGAL